MPTQSESPAAVSGTSSKTLQLLRKRLRQLLRVMLVLTICLAVAATALAIWWLTSLNGLPDIGDPFDVAAFRTFRLPDEQNAFTFFRRAWKAVEPIYGGRLVRDQSGVPRVCRGEPPGGGTVYPGGRASGWDIRAGRRAAARRE